MNASREASKAINERIVKICETYSDEEFVACFDVIAKMAETQKTMRSRKWDRIWDIAKMVISAVITLTANIVLAILILSFEHFVPATSKILGWVRPLTV